MTSSKSQLPAEDEIFLDHVGWMVPDMAQASLALLRLGFLLTPFSEHSNKNPQTGEILVQGSANRLAMLGRGYLEILCAVENVHTDVTRHLASCVERYVGVHLVAFSVADAGKEAHRLGKEGFDLQPTVHLRRTVESADGKQVEVAFSVIRPRFGSLPEGRIQTLAHHTPEHLWQPRYLAKDNALAELSGVIFATSSPAQSASRMAQYTDRPAQPVDRGSRIELNRGTLEFMTPKTIEQCFAGLLPPALPSVAALRFCSNDLDKSRSYFKRREITLLRDQPDQIIIHPSQALGVALIVDA